MNARDFATHRAGNSLPGRVVGVEVTATVIRAAVFSPDFELCGKMKLSTKLQRGSAAVIDRLERCVRYAIDEADQRVESIESIGVAVPWTKRVPTGSKGSEPGFDEMAMSLQPELERRLGIPVRAGNVFDLATGAVHAFEDPGQSADIVVLFPGAILGAGILVGGKVKDPAEFPEGAPWLPEPSGHVIHRTIDERFCHFRARDFRKAIRKGNKAAEKLIRESVVEGVTSAAQLLQVSSIRCVVLAGGGIDENKAEMIAEARTTLASILNGPLAAEIKVVASELGDLAVLLGAAFPAGRQASLPSDPPLRAGNE